MKIEDDIQEDKVISIKKRTVTSTYDYTYVDFITEKYLDFIKNKQFDEIDELYEKTNIKLKVHSKKELKSILSLYNRVLFASLEP